MGVKNELKDAVLHIHSRSRCSLVEHQLPGSTVPYIPSPLESQFSSSTALFSKKNPHKIINSILCLNAKQQLSDTVPLCFHFIWAGYSFFTLRSVQKLEIGWCDEGWLRLELGGVLLVVWCFQSLSGFPFIVALFIHHHTSSAGLSNNSVVTTVVLSQTGLMTFTETQTVSAFPQPRKPNLTFPAATRAETMATGVVLNLLAFMCCRF